MTTNGAVATPSHVPEPSGLEPNYPPPEKTTLGDLDEQCRGLESELEEIRSLEEALADRRKEFAEGIQSFRERLQKLEAAAGIARSETMTVVEMRQAAGLSREVYTGGQTHFYDVSSPYPESMKQPAPTALWLVPPKEYPAGYKAHQRVAYHLARHPEGPAAKVSFEDIMAAGGWEKPVPYLYRTINKLVELKLMRPIEDKVWSPTGKCVARYGVVTSENV